jgi:hypothetical protein
MTNRELLEVPESLLGKLDRQRLYLLRVERTPVPCPACQTPVNVFDAAGIDLDAYDFGATKYTFQCPACSAPLEQVLPFIAFGGPFWQWQLKGTWLQDQLRNARALDERRSEGRDAAPA